MIAKLCTLALYASLVLHQGAPNQNVQAAEGPRVTVGGLIEGGTWYVGGHLIDAGDGPWTFIIEVTGSLPVVKGPLFDEQPYHWGWSGTIPPGGMLTVTALWDGTPMAVNYFEP